MKKIKVKQLFDGGDCETCGYWTSSDTEVYLDNKLIFKEVSDDHLRGGEEYLGIEKMKPIFETLGYSFEYTCDYGQGIKHLYD